MFTPRILPEAALPISEFLVDLMVALVLGAVVGLERQFRGHAVGLRTNALVCLGAALFVSVSRLTGDSDSTRVASYVVSGVGFLGGGVILRDGFTVKGLDTAATLWCGAAVGVLAGAGFQLHAAAGAVAVLALNLVLRPLVGWIESRLGQGELREGASDGLAAAERTISDDVSPAACLSVSAQVGQSDRAGARNHSRHDCHSPVGE